MGFDVGIQQSPDHPLILGVVAESLAPKKIDAPFAKRKRDFDSLLAKRKFLGRREKIGNDTGFAQMFIRVFDFRAHRLLCPFSSNRLQRFE